MSAEEDPLWKRVWKTEGIRWLGPRGDGVADAMERFQHGFECGAQHASYEWMQVAKDLAEAFTAAQNYYAKGEKPPELITGLLLEACRSYDRLLEQFGSEGGEK